MESKEEVHETVEAARGIDFLKSADKDVDFFGTAIRYLGGFLAAYDLCEEKGLLDKAVEISEMLLVPFDTPNHMPITRWDWKRAMIVSYTQEAPKSVLDSEIGFLGLVLSQVTGDRQWYAAIHRITQLFDAQQRETRLPGLCTVVVNARDRDLTSKYGFTLGGISGSTYEYLPKMYALLGGLMPVLSQATRTVHDSRGQALILQALYAQCTGYPWISPGIHTPMMMALPSYLNRKDNISLASSEACWASEDASSAAKNT